MILIIIPVLHIFYLILDLCDRGWVTKSTEGNFLLTRVKAIAPMDAQSIWSQGTCKKKKKMNVFSGQNLINFNNRFFQTTAQIIEEGNHYQLITHFKRQKFKAINYSIIDPVSMFSLKSALSEQQIQRLLVFYNTFLLVYQSIKYKEKF